MTMMAVNRPGLRWLQAGTRLEAAWVGFALLNLAAVLAIIMLRLGQGWETVPFHFIYVSFTILYGLRAWRGRAPAGGIRFLVGATRRDCPARGGPHRRTPAGVSRGAPEYVNVLDDGL